MEHLLAFVEHVVGLGEDDAAGAGDGSLLACSRLLLRSAILNDFLELVGLLLVSLLDQDLKHSLKQPLELGREWLHRRQVDRV